LPHQKLYLSRVQCAPNHNICKHTSTSPDSKMHNQIEHVLIDEGRHSCVLDFTSYRGADCDTVIWCLRKLETVSK